MFFTNYIAYYLLYGFSWLLSFFPRWLTILVALVILVPLAIYTLFTAAYVFFGSLEFSFHHKGINFLCRILYYIVAFTVSFGLLMSLFPLFVDILLLRVYDNSALKAEHLQDTSTLMI